MTQVSNGSEWTLKALWRILMENVRARQEGQSMQCCKEQLFDCDCGCASRTAHVSVSPITTRKRNVIRHFVALYLLVSPCRVTSTYSSRNTRTDDQNSYSGTNT
ncbi:hypothetical protein E2C01_039643 [Portunus trituberculatus]|uniref:Uncharacterized protein n=1 Tax=Portunus trituberculatus TaxID=210409 RepID=A0A5B7FKB6_PORTR|nr:hypothetical protein [Portunus trituberculatus]